MERSAPAGLHRARSKLTSTWPDHNRFIAGKQLDDGIVNTKVQLLHPLASGLIATARIVR